MSKLGRKVIKRHLRRIAKRAIRRVKLKRLVRKGYHVKRANYAKPKFGSIMLA